MSRSASASVHGPVLDTTRLILRPPRAEDFEAWAVFAADPKVARFLGGPQPRAVAWRGFIGMAGAWSLYGFGMFSVIEKASGRWLGRVGPWRPEGWPGGEVGWALVPAAEGRGYAFEATVAAMDWVFSVLGWDTVIHCIAPGNARSVRLAERLGSRLRGQATRPAPVNQTVDIYGQTQTEWLGNGSRCSASPCPPSVEDRLR